MIWVESQGKANKIRQTITPEAEPLKDCVVQVKFAKCPKLSSLFLLGLLIIWDSGYDYDC